MNIFKGLFIRNENVILERITKSDLVPKSHKTFPTEMNILNSKFSFRGELAIGLAMLLLPWLFLLKHFEIKTFFGIGIMFIMGLFIIIRAKEKLINNRYDIGKKGIFFQDKLYEWHKIKEIQRVRLAKKRRTEILRIISNEAPTELPLNSDLAPKPFIIVDYIKYMINNN
ncbi:hypothetical protein [Crocinitomix catalasitica]|uniref:hypothetical protein n=1 Tax=Crocinitomix catalasitica TaxID=184607 RepID=UPI000483E2F4|nr:hypothetical protein [Crocinitomix catalasitica]